MSATTMRIDGRSLEQIRPVTILYNAFGYADSSVLISVGNTKVLCTVTVQNGVPPFLRGQQSGWLTAEYAMLPNSGSQRIPREISLMRKNGRSTEISRLIGRALRVMVDLKPLGERTITVDCDVLQADGGTRVAAITGASLALQCAEKHWLKNKLISEPIVRDAVAAISVGIQHADVLVDPNYAEDSELTADCNVIMTRSGKVVEFQVGAEKEALSWEQLQQVHAVAYKGIQHLFTLVDGEQPRKHDAKKPISKRNVPLFSLQNR